MDPKLMEQFSELWHSLCAEDQHPLPEGTFHGSKLWLIRDSQLTSERLKKLTNLIQIKFPFLLACKSDLFWKESKEEIPVLPQTITRRKKKSSSSSVNENNSSVVGSPLKLDVIADLSAIDDSYLPSQIDRPSTVDCGLSVKTGRQMLSLFSTGVTSRKDRVDADQVPMMILLCDAKHFQPLSCMSVNILVDKQNNFIGLKNTQVCSKKAAELSVHRKMGLNFGVSEVTCHAKYDLLVDEDSISSGDQSSIGVVLDWKKRSDLALIPLMEPPRESKAMVKIQVTSGNCRSPAFALFQELQILKSLVQGLATTEVDWIGVQERPLVDCVADLVEQLKVGCNSVMYNLGETTLDDCSLDDLKTLTERNDFDFTDHLWKVLQNCTSYAELVESFSYIVSVMKTGELQPFIQGRNNTTIALMVKDSYKGQLQVPSLVGLHPIRYLAEIGIMKLVRDYIFLLVSKGLATVGNLDYFMKDNLELEEKLVRLRKLHNILEVVLMLKQCVNLPLSTLTDCTRQMLKHFEKKGEDSNQFAFNVPTEDVKHIIEKYTPVEWKAEGYKMVDKYQERTAYLYTVQQPCDWAEIEVSSNRNMSHTDVEDETSYFLTVVTESVRILNS